MRISASPTLASDFLTPAPGAVRSAQARIRVALFVSSFRLGGAERQVFHLAEYLDREKYEITLITLTTVGELAPNFYSLNGVKVVGLNGSNPLQIVLRLAQILRQVQIRVLHSFTTAPNAYSLIAKAFKRDVRLVLGIRTAVSDPGFGSLSFYLRAKQRAVEWFIRVFSFAADFVVSNSEAAYELNGKKFSAPSAVVPNGIDTEKFKPDPASRRAMCEVTGLDSESKAKFVGIVANCTAHKDYPSFVRAARLVADQHRDVHFVSIGDDRTVLGESLRGLVADLALGPIFHFLGVRTDVEKLLPGLDILCSSSATEAFSNAICEGMACGVPCVVTDVGDSRRIVGDTGIVVPPQNPEALATGLIIQLGLNPVERERLTAAARQRILQNFDVERMATRHEHLYEALLAKATHKLEMVHPSA